jgi:hypothetical protein
MNFMSQWSLENFYFSFYVWWIFFTSLAFGATFFVLIHFATKASWSVTLRRLAENVSLTLPMLFVFGIVCYFGRDIIYQHWLSPESFTDTILNSKRWYLNVPFFTARAVLFFGIFCTAALVFASKSIRQDATGCIHLTRQMQKMSYAFLILCGFAATFSAFDWIMSLDPHWYSTIFGLYFFAGCYVSFLSFLSVMVFILRKSNPKLAASFHIEHIHDLAKQVFGYSCFWAYAAFAQYLLIWYGNMPEETMWYAVRQSQGWWPMWTLLCIGHFIVPFLFLMSRWAKRTPVIVCAVSVWVLCMHYLDLYWLIIPNFSEAGPTFGVMDLVTFVLFASLFLAIIITLIKKRNIIPVRDPRLEESLNYEN